MSWDLKTIDMKNVNITWSLKSHNCNCRRHAMKTYRCSWTHPKADLLMIRSSRPVVWETWDSWSWGRNFTWNKVFWTARNSNWLNRRISTMNSHVNKHEGPLLVGHLIIQNFNLSCTRRQLRSVNVWRRRRLTCFVNIGTFKGKLLTMKHWSKHISKIAMLLGRSTLMQ